MFSTQITQIIRIDADFLCMICENLFHLRHLCAKKRRVMFNHDRHNGFHDRHKENK